MAVTAARSTQADIHQDVIWLGLCLGPFDPFPAYNEPEELTLSKWLEDFLVIFFF